MKLIFVYAVDGGLFASVVDYAHKLLSPATYRCQLCQLTYGALGPHKAWSSFLRELALPVVFLHQDELRALHPLITNELPALYLERTSGLELLAGAHDINDCGDLRSLIALVSACTDKTRG